MVMPDFIDPTAAYGSYYAHSDRVAPIKPSLLNEKL